MPVFLFFIFFPFFIYLLIYYLFVALKVNLEKKNRIARKADDEKAVKQIKLIDSNSIYRPPGCKFYFRATRDQ